MKKLLKIAKQILDLNEYSCLTGTLMLQLRGINLGRKPHDIDILLKDYAPNIVFPKKWGIMKPTNEASDGTGAKYKYKDIIIDVMSSGEKPELLKGFKLGTVDELIKAKYMFSLQNNNEAQKHHNDLIKLGFKFPKESDPDNLPF